MRAHALAERGVAFRFLSYIDGRSTTMITRLESLPRVLLLLALALFAHRAQAELQFCVSTTVQLKQALQDAKDQEQAATIRLVQGTYDDVIIYGFSGFNEYPDRLAIY